VKPIAHVAFALLVAALQITLLRWLGGGAFPVLLLAACVVHQGLAGGNVDGAVASAGVGYVIDLVAGTPKGLFTFLAVVAFLLVRGASVAVDVRGRPAFGLLSGGAALMMSLGALLLVRYTSADEAAPGLTLVPRALLEAVLTGLAAPILLPALRRLDGLFQREEPGLLR
jgi:rod shape-determining protein MreD